MDDTIECMSEKSQEQPFQKLGNTLRDLRKKSHESVLDVSGAVEIDESALEKIEAGRERPSEDILNLLISHFGMQDDDAANLWHLAGYDRPHNHDDDIPEELASGRAGMLVMAIDPRVIYTDGVHVNAGPNGVVLSFAQTASMQQPLVTARVGMSREQARNIIRVLQGALDKTEPRELPSGKKSNDTDATDESTANA